jgi:hypothetical protein
MTDYSEYEMKCRNAHDKNFLNNTPTEFQELYFGVRHFTMLSRERLYDVFLSCRYLAEAKVVGDIVEVGCWGGGTLALALSATQNDEVYRTVWGYDTFEGHPEPSADELDVWGNSQLEKFQVMRRKGEGWASKSLDEVLSNIEQVSRTEISRLRLVKGKAEESIQRQHPESVAILRIDVDWYEPSLAAWQQLYPRVPSGGIVIVDDYGHHSGSKKAFLEFFGSRHPKFTHVDYSCISFVKP